ncbi:MAG TPA: cytochrome oxidase [Devosia sp.]|nr:cytochrome oxidase [Devosia sp.]
MSEAKTPREFTGRHMLILVLTFFGVVFGVNALMAFMAARSWTGLVVKNTYVASQEFNEKLAASRAQAELNWQVGLTYRDGQLIFDLVDDLGQPLEIQAVEIALTRPIGVSQDRKLALLPQGEKYVVRQSIPSGVWNVVINADVQGYPEFLYRARLIIDPEHSPDADAKSP